MTSKVAPPGRSASRAGSSPRSGTSLQYACFISSYCARVHEVTPPGRSASRAGLPPRSVLVALIFESCRRGVGSERVHNPAAGRRSAFVSSGASVVGRSCSPLQCSIR
ncbi:hypothetical protein F2Q70_00022718 [Brassica cretica]|uniref:Uncharacterized protein n=1 Tax=Brassica cretica TaxID=69181 RepID=A0A8S9GJJ7_BRACR|nr:hypothetical protein F2Q70_00022718 [Brassica cretica]KAF2555086.1 hypothetical protein F2Q68_00016939 [Brassica cretica]